MKEVHSERVTPRNPWETARRGLRAQAGTQDSGEEEDEPGALVLPKISYVNKTGKEKSVPVTSCKKLQTPLRFLLGTIEVPAGYQRTGTRTDSHIYSCGVNMDMVPVGVGATGRTKKWMCLATLRCRHNQVNISTKDAKSGVNKHLKHQQHDIVGKVRVTRQSTRDEMTSSCGHYYRGQFEDVRGWAKEVWVCVLVFL